MSTTRRAKRAAQKKKEKEHEGVVVTTSRGAVGECMPIAMMIESQEENIRNSVKWPEIPTYTFVDVAGVEIERQHTQATIEDDATSEDDKQAWADYLIAKQAARQEFDERRNMGLMNLLAFEGFKVLDEQDGWAERHVRYGMEVPDDPFERVIHYFQTEVIGTQDDVYKIMLGIYRASGYDEEVMSRVEASFRAKMGKSKETRQSSAAGKGEGDISIEEEGDVVRETDMDDDGRADSPGD